MQLHPKKLRSRNPEINARPARAVLGESWRDRSRSFLVWGAMNQQIAKYIAFNILKYLSPCGMKAGRYIYTSTWRNQLIDMLSEGVEIDA